MSMLNDYLNGYSEKLARATTTAPSNIKIDQLHFKKIVKSVNAATLNPYREYQDLINAIKELDKKHIAMEALKKKELAELKAKGISREEMAEDANIKEQLKQITKTNNEDTKTRQARLYQKGLSVN